MYDAQLNGGGRAVPTNTSIRSDPGTLVGTSRDENIVFVKDFLRVLWRRWWVILSVVAAFVVLAVVFDSLRTPVYEADIKIVVGQQQGGDVPSNFVSNVEGLQQLAQTVVQVLPTQTVAEAVARRLGSGTDPESILGNMKVKQAGTTQVVDVSYRDPDPEKAQQIANAVGDVFSEQISELSPDANAVTATVWERAVLPDFPASPNPLRDVLIALVAGGTLGAGLAFLLEQLDDRWRSPEEMEQISGVPTFGVVREFEVPKSKKGKADAPQESWSEPSEVPLPENSRSRRARRAQRKKGLLSWLVSG